MKYAFLLESIILLNGANTTVNGVDTLQHERKNEGVLWSKRREISSITY